MAAARQTFVVIGTDPHYLINFRGALIARLVQLGFQVVACVIEATATQRKAIEAMGAEVEIMPIARTGMNPLRDLATLAALYRLMRRTRPRHVLAYTIKPVTFGLLAARLAGVRGRHALITGLGYAFVSHDGQGRLVRQIAERLYALALRRATAVMFQNEDDREVFVSHGLVDPRCTHVINGSGVDCARFAPQPMPAGPPAFLLIARLLRDKGIVEYVAAARAVKARFPHAAVRLLGPLDTNPAAIRAHELESWIREGAIEYLGSTDDVRPALAACSVFVLPSYREGTPRTVLEAMATGRPIITTDVPGCRETTRDGDNGRIVPARNASVLAEAMMQLADDPELAARMGQRSLALARERYDVHKVNAAMLAIMGLMTPSVGRGGELRVAEP